MHRIIKSHLDSFVASEGLNQHNESDQFEMFANFSILSPKLIEGVDFENVTTGEGDDGTDGLAIIINEELIQSKEDAELIFTQPRRNNEVELVFIQTKRSESFDLGDFLKFKESVLKFITSDQYDANDTVQLNAFEIYNVALTNVPKIRNGKPSITLRYVTTGIYQNPQALEDAKNGFIRQLEELSYFINIDLQFIGRDELTQLWVSSYSGVNAQLNMFSNAPLPPISGIEEAYLAVVNAKEFVSQVLTNENGNLRSNVFEENVRAFLGIENPVNVAISDTINNLSTSSRFPVLNNGITIIAEDVRVQGSLLHLDNYQIVNGCQTSNVLFENKSNLQNELMLNIKVIETTNDDVFSDVVRATNSQTKVDGNQFISLKPLMKKIEAYFNTYEGQDGRIYLERREKQYAGKDVPNIRIFPIKIAAKSVCAMFLDRPDLSFRYPNQMYDQYSNVLFADDVKEIVYYTACLALYKIHLFVANAEIPQNSRKYKWHIIHLLPYLVIEKANKPNLNAKQIKTYCETLISVLHDNDQLKDKINEALAIIQSIPNLTDDRLKRQAASKEMIDEITKTVHNTRS